MTLSAGPCRLAVMKQRSVVIVAFAGVQPLDAAGPFEVFAGASRAVQALGRPGGYSVALVSTDGDPVRADSGLGLCTTALPDAGEPIDTLVLAGGDGVESARRDEALLSWISTVAPRCRRVATVCSGAFLAAEAGLLDGRRVTTHWARAEQLATEFPALEVDSDPDLHPGRQVLDQRRGHRRDRPGPGPGARTTSVSKWRRSVARWLVMFLHRPGWPDPVRLAGVGATGRAFHRPGRADPGGGRPRRGSPPSGPGRGGGHERAPFRPGVHRRGRRDPGPVRGTRPARRRPGESSRPPTTPST